MGDTPPERLSNTNPLALARLRQNGDALSTVFNP
jgi:hypothetical protein